MTQHRREPHAAHRGQAAGEQAVQPGFCAGAAHFVTRIDRGIEHPGSFPRSAHFFGHNAVRVRATHGGVLGESARAARKKLRCLHAPGAAKKRAVGGQEIVHRRRLQRTARGQLFIGVGNHETPRVELPRHVAQVALLRGKGPVARHVHAEDVVARVAIDHPLRKREADGAALRETAHAAAGHPVVLLARHGAHQRVAVGRESEGAVHPALDAHLGERGEAGKADLQLRQDTIDVGRQKIHAVVPGRALGAPVTRVALVDAEQHALPLGLHVGETLEIGDGHHLVV